VEVDSKDMEVDSKDLGSSSTSARKAPQVQALPMFWQVGISPWLRGQGRSFGPRCD
jgi:hypothetical protein